MYPPTHTHTTNNIPDHYIYTEKAHSTEAALLKVHNDIALALDQGNSAVLGMLDLSAVFDTIDHAILLNRLEHHYGLAGEVKDWVVSYLGGRRQRVCIGDDKSSEKDLFYSVPQESILGVEYYCLYSKPPCRCHYQVPQDDISYLC